MIIWFSFISSSPRQIDHSSVIWLLISPAGKERTRHLVPLAPRITYDGFFFFTHHNYKIFAWNTCHCSVNAIALLGTGVRKKRHMYIHGIHPRLRTQCLYRSFVCLFLSMEVIFENLKSWAELALYRDTSPQQQTLTSSERNAWITSGYIRIHCKTKEM
jgi:hypothetical protein